ncbi:hypothetical protein GH975_05675 [Litorivicinus lipolyticus]|uniref:Uncharacterized protein n=1 Tax=Litorivicinus lipolyticus TaxID=418701 RepID=A0A5Q2Q7R5_9GAMM|nr:hypothetical protein [Litorivicinus lipolyticus]QGG80088.1 hypothetical protein GH975_05675 [Litorivicinus lipolyticus]
MHPALIIGIALVLGGCAVQTPVVDSLDARLSQALGQPLSSYANALGDAAVVAADGALTRHGWRNADLIKPCEVELWADTGGVIRKVAWTGYDRSCRALLERLP